MKDELTIKQLEELRDAIAVVINGKTKKMERSYLIN